MNVKARARGVIQMSRHMSVGNPLCPCGIPYHRTYRSSTSGLFKKRLVTSDDETFDGAFQVVHCVSSSLLGPKNPAFGTLSGRLKFTVQRHKFRGDSFFQLATCKRPPPPSAVPTQLPCPPPPSKKQARAGWSGSRGGGGTTPPTSPRRQTSQKAFGA